MNSRRHSLWIKIANVENTGRNGRQEDEQKPWEMFPVSDAHGAKYKPQFPIPNSRPIDVENPNPKLQIPRGSRHASTNSRHPFGFGFWIFPGIWVLEIGI